MSSSIMLAHPKNDILLFSVAHGKKIRYLASIMVHTHQSLIAWDQAVYSIPWLVEVTW